jgi:AraC-like DNA-binding protein
LIFIWIHRSFTDAVSITSSSNLAENPSFIFNKYYYVLLIISLLIYWIFSIRLILSHRKNIPYFFSNYSKNNTLTWLIFVVFIFLFLIVADRFLSSLQKVLGIAVFQFLSISSNLTIFTFIMVFFGINQTVIFKYKQGKTGRTDADPTLKYKHSSLSEKQKDEISARVTTYLKTNKSYLIPDYSLQMMAEELQISRQNLSQVINESQHKNFYQLINEFRIKEVKEKMADTKFEIYTVLGIAFECGFNSKTTFNRIFKESTGKTPSEYRKSLKYSG